MIPLRTALHPVAVMVLLAALLTPLGCGKSGGSNSTYTSNASAGPTAAISGTVQYEDRQYGADGFTGAILDKAVRFGMVEVVDSASGQVLVAGATDATGAYSLSFVPSGPTVYVRAISEVLLSGASVLEVRNLAGNLYSVGGPDVAVSAKAQATSSFIIPMIGYPGGAFNILDVYTSAREFIYSLAGAYPPPLKAYWQTGNASVGTWYCTNGGPGDSQCPMQGEAVYVKNEITGDTDEYDDDVLWHEFGHFTAAHFSRDDSPGGAHFLSSNDLDLRLAWSEGWGDFFPGAIKTWLSAQAPSLLSTTSALPLSQYVDTSDTSQGSTAKISIDIGNPDPPKGGSPYYYATNELAVAKVLWDLQGSVFGMRSVWDVFSPYLAKVAAPASMETFWDGWMQRPTAPQELSVVEPIYAGRRINYSVDTYEPDDTFVSGSSMTTGSTQGHTLYPDNDADFAAFDAIQGRAYTVRTLNLKNGADTFLTLYGPDTQLLASNDNVSPAVIHSPSPPDFCMVDPDSHGICHANGNDVLSSQVTFTAQVAGTYYVRITSSSNRPASAGRYGSYDLQVTTSP